MILTSIFKFRKPEGTDPVNIADVNANMDIIEMELNKRPEKTGAASEMTAVFSEGKEVKALEPGETLGTSLGKIAKLVTDYISFRKEVGDGSGAVSEALGGLKFGQDANGNWGYILPGTTEVIPFGRGESNWGGEIENADWEKVPSGIYSDFLKAIYKNGYLVAITVDGTILYTRDGEAWDKSKLEYQDCGLTDVDYDGEKFLVTGSYTSGGKTAGLLLATEDFKAYEQIQVQNSDDSETEYDIEYCAVYPKNGRFIIIARRKTDNYLPFFWYIGDLKSEWVHKGHISVRSDLTSTNFGASYKSIKAAVAKNSGDMFLWLQFEAKYSDCYISIYWFQCDINGAVGSCQIIHARNSYVFECKDTLFYCDMYGSNYNQDFFAKLESDRIKSISTVDNFTFVDGCYFNECEVFVTEHAMLVVKKGESISDKTASDMMEIVPENAMTCIVKAFGRPYIFGNRGLIMRPV